MTNVAWSPSPIGDSYIVWAQPTPRHDAMREALKLVPDDASVAATYTLLPHLSHRAQIYDWPNPWVPSYWGNDDGYRLPDPSTIDYIVLDRTQVGPAQQALVASFIAPGRPVRGAVRPRRRVGRQAQEPAPSDDGRSPAGSCRSAGSARALHELADRHDQPVEDA